MKIVMKELGKLIDSMIMDEHIIEFFNSEEYENLLKLLQEKDVKGFRMFLKNIIKLMK